MVCECQYSALNIVYKDMCFENSLLFSDWYILIEPRGMGNNAVSPRAGICFIACPFG